MYRIKTIKEKFNSNISFTMLLNYVMVKLIGILLYTIHIVMFIPYIHGERDSNPKG